jgi:hypothetical protein
MQMCKWVRRFRRLLNVSMVAAACAAAACPLACPLACPAADEPAIPESLPSIFNGRDLAGWQVPPEPSWRVEDGVIVGASNADMKGSMLYTEKEYGDVVFETDVRFSGEIDSGIIVRRPELQVQIGVSRSLKRDMTCSFYTGSYPEEARAAQATELLKANDWNRIRVAARGDTFTVWLNGRQVSRYRSDAYRRPGPIGLQIHSNVVMKVEFRNLRALPL